MPHHRQMLPYNILKKYISSASLISSLERLGFNFTSPVFSKTGLPREIQPLRNTGNARHGGNCLNPIPQETEDRRITVSCRPAFYTVRSCLEIKEKTMSDIGPGTWLIMSPVTVIYSTTGLLQSHRSLYYLYIVQISACSSLVFS